MNDAAWSDALSNVKLIDIMPFLPSLLDPAGRPVRAVRVMQEPESEVANLAYFESGA